MKENLKIYICGPIRHVSDPDVCAQVMEQFDSVQKMLTENFAKCNPKIFNPMHNGLCPCEPRAEHIHTDIINLMECDCMYVMDGWQTSSVCVNELMIAYQLGINILNRIDEFKISLSFSPNHKM